MLLHCSQPTKFVHHLQLQAKVDVSDGQFVSDQYGLFCKGTASVSLNNTEISSALDGVLAGEDGHVIVTHSVFFKPHPNACKECLVLEMDNGQVKQVCRKWFSRTNFFRLQRSNAK
jgi:hypothetical protein